MDKKTRSESFYNPRIKPSRSQHSYELPSRSSTLAGVRLSQSSPERLKAELNNSKLETNPQTPMSANPFTYSQYRLNTEEDGTAFRAELDATENVTVDARNVRSIAGQQQRQQKEYWGPEGRF